MAVVEIKAKRLAGFFKAAVKGTALREIADLTRIPYEQLRRMVRGHRFPTESMLETLCAALKADYDEALACLHADRSGSTDLRRLSIQERNERAGFE